MTPQEAVQRIAEFECAVRVQKLGRSTAICDCAQELWVFLGLTREQVFFCEGKRPQVCDFPFDIWVCQIGIGNHGTRRRTAYGRSFSEAVNAATSNAEVTGVPALSARPVDCRVGRQNGETE